jgi:cation transport regulator
LPERHVFEASLEERSILPYASVNELPSSVLNHLPAHALEIYRSAFNNAWVEYENRGPEKREQLAHRVAWAAVKRKYEKADDRWVPRGKF